MDNEVVYQGFFTVEKDRKTGWEILRSPDSVAILVAVPEWNQVLMITQSRPPMVRDDNPDGRITEMPAGRLDKPGLDYVDIAVAEVEEEVGVKITRKDVRLFNDGVPLALSPGGITERMYLAWVEIAPSQIDLSRETFGCASERERITRKFVPVADLGTMTYENMATCTLSLMYLRELERRQSPEPGCA